jgi:DNA primase
MKRLPEAFLEELRRRVDIVDVVSEHVQLRRAGRSFIGLCPFHNERSPSMSVSPERQMFHCFGCGAGGTVFRFLMDIEGISFMEAVVQLTARANLELPDDIDLTVHAKPPDVRFQQMKDAHELAAKLYNYILMNTDAGVQALTYLENRGLSKQTIFDFRIGYAPDRRDFVVSFLQRRGFTRELLAGAGLGIVVGENIVDRFRGRVMIPIADLRGNVVGFGGRTLIPDGKPKYLNSPDTDVFHKGLLLFHHDVARKEIRKARTAVMFEGYMDVISATQAGVKNGVATLGTSLTPEQAALLQRDCDRVIVVYDGDKAGISGAKRAIDIFGETGLQLSVVSLPNGLDPDEYIRNYGSSSFARELSVHAQSTVQFLLQCLHSEADLLSPVGRTGFMRKALELLAQRASPIEQEVELRKLAGEFDVSVATLKEELRLVEKPAGKKNFHYDKKTSVQQKEAALPKGFIEAGNRLLQMLMVSNEAFEYLQGKGLDELATPEQTALLALLYGWRITHPEAGPAAFLDELDDESLLGVATSLLIEDPVQFESRLVDDYIRTIELHRTEESYKQTLAKLVQAQVQGDLEQTAQIKLRVDAYLRQIAALKLPGGRTEGQG